MPIIMLTGWGHRLIATDDKPEQVDRVLSKPPKMAELRSTLCGAGAAVKIADLALRHIHRSRRRASARSEKTSRPPRCR